MFENSENKVKMNSDFLLEMILSDTNELLVFVDKDGIIVELSKAYAEFLKVERCEAIGKHVSDVIENSRMHIVIKTGKAEIEATQKIHGKNMIANRIPVYHNEKIVGAFGRVVFRDTAELYSLSERIKEMEVELDYYKKNFNQSNRSKYTLNDIIGRSVPMTELKNKIQRIAQNNSNILILGESGTGKELYAHAIHDLSARRKRPFICVNCASIPGELLESELFGYEEGAFTGAKKGGKMGLFQAANGGTIFLDEIGELPLNMQVKMLRVLQEREVKKIGSTVTEAVDVRILSATNRNLEKMVDSGDFRSDLYYRLNVVRLVIPPLRDRRQDVPDLVYHFIEKLAGKEEMPFYDISDKAMRMLMNYDWPGNVRELENVIERAGNFVGADGVIGTEHLPLRVTKNVYQTDIRPLGETMGEYEKKVVQEALINCHSNKVLTAKMLGISRTALYEKMNKYGIKSQREKKEEKKTKRDKH